MAKLDLIRAIAPAKDPKAVERQNREMDEAWKFFNANKTAALPVLRRELAAELKKDRPNQMLLLDIGYFIRLQDAAADKELGRAAFLAIDPAAEIVRWNGKQLFEFAHAVAPDRDPKVLVAFDRAFLRGDVTVFVPQHALRLDGTLVCVFLYGLYGHDGEMHLQALLADKSVARKAVETLIWIGSPDSVPQVAAAMGAARDYETFARATAFMMQTGGPEGRAVMLGVKPQDYDARSREYYAKVRGDIAAVSYETLRKPFSRLSGPASLPDEELKKRLADMYANYGRDDKTNPAAVLASKLPKEFLIGELMRIRQRMFYRLSDEALDDVQMTNALLNALRYRSN